MCMPASTSFHKSVAVGNLYQTTTFKLLTNFLKPSFVWASRLSRSRTCLENFSWDQNSIMVFSPHFIQTLISIQPFFWNYIFIRVIGQLFIKCFEPGYTCSYVRLALKTKGRGIRSTLSLSSGLKHQHLLS